MNSTFKVVFNKARGALMVVNEVTSTVQAKGTKTVIAAAVAALVAGGAIAADGAAATEDFKLESLDPVIAADKWVNGEVKDNKGITADEYTKLYNAYKAKYDEEKANSDVKNKVASTPGLYHVTGDDKSLVIKGSNVHNNTFEMHRGLVRVSGNATLSVENSTFTDNLTAFGGAIDSFGGKELNVTSSKFVKNTARYHGGAIRIDGNTQKAKIAGATFEGNKALSNSGAIHLASANVVEIINTKFIANESQIKRTDNGNDVHGGGAMWIMNGVTKVDISKSLFEGNKAETARGGAIAIGDKDFASENNTAITITNSTFKNNSASQGGAIEAFNTKNLTVTDTDFIGNTSGGWAGAILLDKGEMTIKADKADVKFSDNKSGTDAKNPAPTNYAKTGDAMYIKNGGKVTFDAAKGRVIDIADSIVSNATAVTAITTQGLGTVKFGDLTGYVGKLNVTGGKAEIAGGIGEYDVGTQYNQNVATTNAGVVGSVATTVTVSNDASLKLGEVVINRSAGTTFVTQDKGTIEMDKLTLTSATYADRVFDAKSPKAKDLVTHGNGSLSGNVTVKNEVNVEASTTLAMTGKITVGSINTAAKVANTDTTPEIVAGTVNGDADVQILGNADSTNAGSLTAASITIENGTFTNKGALALTGKDTETTHNYPNGNLWVKKGATFVTSFGSETVTQTGVDAYISEGATLNITGLNGKSGSNTTDTPDALEFKSGTYGIDGTLAVAGKEYTGNLVINGTGESNFAEVAFGVDKTFEKIEQKAGKLTVEEGAKLTVSKKLTNVDNGIHVDNFSTLSVAGSAIDWKVGTDGAISHGLKTIANNGTLEITGTNAVVFNDLPALTAFSSAINATGSTGLVKFADGASIKTTTGMLNDNGQLKTDSANGLAGVEIEAFKNTPVNVTGTLSGGSFGGLVLADVTTTTGPVPVATVAGGLTLNGIAGSDNLVSFTRKAEGKTTVEAGNVLLQNGAALTTTNSGKIGSITQTTGRTDKANVNVVAGNLEVLGNVAVDSLNVVEGSSLTMSKANASATSVGTLNVRDLYVGGNIVAGDVTVGSADIEGVLTADKLNGNVTVGTDEEGYSKAGKLVANELTSGTVFADPAWKDGSQLTLGETSQVALGKITAGTVVAGQGSIVALGTTDADAAVKAVAKAGHTVLGAGEGMVKSAIYVEGGKKYDAATDTTTYTSIKGNVIASGWNEAAYADATPADKQYVQVLENNLMVVNMDTVDTTGDASVFEDIVTNKGTIYLANADLGEKVKLGSSYSTESTGVITFNGDRLMTASLKEGVHTIAFDDAKLAAYEGLTTIPVVTSMYEAKAQNGASTSAKFNSWLMSSNNGLDRKDVIAIGNDAAKLGATSAVASVTMDAVAAFNDSVATRTNVLAPRAEGVTVWADVMGGHYEAKELMDGQGYKSDVYGGVLGVDSVVNGYTLGAAFTVATADTDSTNTLVASSTDSDFVGFSVYGAKAFGQFNVAADLGYMKGSNDVSVKAYNLGDFSADTSAFTAGVRGEVLVDAGSFKVVPHAGLRFTHLTTDDFEAAYTTEIDSMNVFQMPVGVTVTGNVEAAGWNVAPMLDLSVVPAFGDTDADMTLGINGVATTTALSTQVIDSNLFQMKLGVAAQKDAFTFGINYKLGAGSDKRVNNTFNATVSYAF